MPTRTEAIKLFLASKTIPDLANLYTPEMEVQVNVAQDDGEPIEGEYKGRKWRGYSNGLETWKPIRIPWNAKSSPEYTDSEMRYNLEAHVEAIGMTGWNWKRLTSQWVAYDFDSLVNHKVGLPQNVLDEIIDCMNQIDWVTIRRSTSGTGLHLYVQLPSIDTANHNEHAALGRSILGKLSAMTAFDLQASVDACGGNMWVWHRKMRNTQGLTLIKQGRPMLESEIPPNWKEHAKTITKHNRKIAEGKVTTSDTFEQLAQQRSHVNLDATHKKLISYMEETSAFWWWDQDLNMLVSHTHWLKRAHEELSLKGIFDTISPCTNTREPNCFLFPLKGGAWSVRRYTPGVQEHPTWEQDGHGWTRCYFNNEPSMQSAARMFGAVEDKKGAYVFQEAEMGAKALELMGIIPNIPTALRGRQMTITVDKKDDRRVKVELKREPSDMPVPGWSPEKNTWFKAYTTRAPSVTQETELADFDDFVRHLVTGGGDDYGWSVYADNEWRFEPIGHIKPALKAAGYHSSEIDMVIGTAVLRPWKKVNLPLQPEYPGRREWNIGSAQLAFTPSADTDNLNYPTWSKVLTHCGAGLDDAVKHNAWAKANGLKCGADYLKCWIASLFQFPMEPLPYLFFYGEQDNGKSVFHESISLLLTKGVKRADTALTSAANFNAELEDAILCVVEETDLQHNKTAYNRIKDWVTGRELLIHKKGMTPYHMPNTTHFVQCANEREACPIFPGDTRITMCWVESLSPMEKIAKNDLFDRMRKEAPDFLAEILNLEIPRTNDRLKIPIITTSDKTAASESNMTPQERFLSEYCHYAPGKTINYRELYDRFREVTDPSELADWSLIKFGKNLPPQYPKGRVMTDRAQWHVGNISFSAPDDGEPELSKIVLIGDKLIASVAREEQR